MLLFIGRGLHGDCLVFEFQNILCYCLSVAKSVHEPPFLKFQNILCYCLSYIRFIQKELIYISKHLMLLFIFKASCNSQHFSAFQNILCYCLSKSHLDRYVTDYISKHLMLLFIFIFFPAATLPSSISKTDFINLLSLINCIRLSTFGISRFPTVFWKKSSIFSSLHFRTSTQVIPSIYYEADVLM